MKVIFSESFKSELKRFDGSVILTKVVLDYNTTQYTSGNIISGLLSSRVDLSNAQEIAGVWDNEKKILNINFNVPENYIINELASNDGENKSDYYREANVLKFLWREDEVAFILICGFKVGEILPSIDFSQKNNIFSVQFPSETIAKNIETITIGDDIEFLEGGGTQAGENIIRVHKKEEGESTVSKNAFIHYCYIYPTDGQIKKDLPIIDTYGRNISNSYIFKQVLSLELTSPFATEVDDSLVVYGLSKSGGYFDFHGTVTYNEYLIEGGRKTLISKSKTAPIDTFSGISLVLETSNGLEIDYDNGGINNYTKRVAFSPRPAEDIAPFGNSATFVLEYYEYDPTSNFRDTVPITSNSIKLVQGDSDSTWRIDSMDTSLFETETSGESIPVFMFEGNSTDTKKLTIITSDNISNSSGENYIPVSLEYEDDGITGFFTISTSTPRWLNNKKCYEITLSIKPVSQNNNSYWLPKFTGEDESRISKITVKNKKHHTSFYAVQKRKLNSPSLYRAGSSTKEREITLTEVSDSNKYFVTSKNIESGRRFWKLIGTNSKVTTELCTPQLGSGYDNEILRKNYSDVVEDNVDYFYISTNETSTDTKSVVLGNYTLYDVPESDVNVSLYGNTDWRYELNSAKGDTITISVKGQDPEIDFAINSGSGSSVDGVGYYNLVVKSNFPYRLTIKTSNVEFTDGKTVLELSSDEFYKSRNYLRTFGFVVKDIDLVSVDSKIKIDYKSTESSVTKTGTFEIPINRKGVKVTGILINPETQKSSTVSNKYYLGNEDIYPVLVGKNTEILVNSPGSVSYTYSGIENLNDYEISIGPAISESGYSYNEAGPEKIRPNQKITINKRTAISELYPVKDKFSLSFYCIEEGGHSNYRVFEKGLAPEFVLLDERNNNVTDSITLPVSTFSPHGSSFKLISRYKLAGNMYYSLDNTEDNYAFLVADSSMMILQRENGVLYEKEIEEEGDHKGWWEYKFNIIKRNSSDAKSKNKKFSIKSFIPVGGKYLNGTTSDITSLLDFSECEDAAKPNVLDLTQEEVNSITSVFERTYTLDFDYNIIYPDNYDDANDSGFILTGLKRKSLSAYKRLNLIAGNKELKDFESQPDNLYGLICKNNNTIVSEISIEDMYGYSNSFVTQPKEDEPAYNISLELEPRQTEQGYKILTLSDSYVIDSLMEAGKSKSIGFSVNVKSLIQGKSHTDRFTISNTQDGVEYALLMSEENSTPKAICGRGNVRSSDNVVFFNKVIDSDNSTDYLDFTIGALGLSSELTTESIIDISRVDITVLRSGVEIYSTKNKTNPVSAPFEILNGGRSYYTTEDLTPNIRLYFNNESMKNTLLYTFVFEVHSDKEVDSDGNSLVIAKGSINITKKPYQFKIINIPEDIYISANGTLVPGADYIDGTNFLFTTDCKLAHLESYGKLRYSFTPGDGSIMTPSDPLSDIYNGKIKKIGESGNYITCGLNIITDPRTDTLSESTSKLSLGIGTSKDVSTIIHQGFFTPVLIDKDGSRHIISMGDTNSVGYKEIKSDSNTTSKIASPLSLGILSLDYKYSDKNKNYSPETTLITSYNSIQSLLSVLSSRWRIILADGTEANVDDYIDSKSRIFGILKYSNSLYYYYRIKPGKENDSFYIVIDYEMEYKLRASDKFKYQKGDYTEDKRDNVIHGGLKINHKITE